MTSDADGAPITKVGAVLSTLNADEGPELAAEFAAASVAVPAAIEIETVPSPEQLVSVTVLVDVPAPLTAFEQVAVPVVLSETLPDASVTELAPL